MLQGEGGYDIPFKMRFQRLNTASKGDLKRSFGPAFDLFWGKYRNASRRRTSREKLFFTRDLGKIAPSAILPLIVAVARLLGANIEPLMGVVTSSLGPIASVTFAGWDKQTLEALERVEKWLKEMWKLYDGILDLYDSSPSPSEKDKQDLLKEWDRISGSLEGLVAPETGAKLGGRVR